MGKFIDLSGERYGRLTVIERVGTMSGHPLWECKCDCGKHTKATTTNLRSGAIVSCGCYNSDVNGRRTHGKSRTRLYSIWKGMRRRCNKETDRSFKGYGGRGITVCKEWDKFEAFQKWSIENGYNDNLSIDRIDTNGNYEPSNCKWSTAKEQNNNKRNNRILEYNGEAHNVTEWAAILGMSAHTIFSRLDLMGWSVEKALSTPMKRVSNYK